MRPGGPGQGIAEKMELKRLRRRDERKCRAFARTGMHFDWYTESRFLQNLYARYFWYLEMNGATKVLAAYEDGNLTGVLLARFEGEKRVRHSFFRTCFVKGVSFFMHVFYHGGAGSYDAVNRKFLEEYRKEYTPDGEIRFLAADPDRIGEGTGTYLLNALRIEEKDRETYLFTDSSCTYQFYDKRGFERFREEEIVMDFGKKQVNLLCFLYRIVL